MNKITKVPLASLGYGFIDKAYLPEGTDEYYQRKKQNNRSDYRSLSTDEIDALKANGNTSDNWTNVFVASEFHPQLVQNCRFYGLVHIGNLESVLLSYSEMNVPVGLYNSTVISCDFGDNVAVHNCAYLSHYIIGNEVIMLNVSEMTTTSHAKFGNGIVKDGEPENVRIWLELCNENAGRSVLPFDGMLPGDAWLWSKYRDNEKLMEKFRQFTDKAFDKTRGYYGTVGDRTVIKNCKIIKDVHIGSDAYLKGANKIKNVTINSAPKAKSQVGEGCEIVNGIIGFGCRIFYGVKAVRFVMADHSQLKYGARLINSYLGSNATISCCEVLNSLIFPAHEQHHNNSFLCAAVVMGQSNIAAGATIGSNHNSRSPDGEIIAGRGFWPGLCVSLKHNSRFASYTILAKGDYPAELDISFPFSLVSNDVKNDRLVVMPGYWFMHNMYALARNSWKYVDRDKRINKVQHIEYDYLAPDTVNEMFGALALLEEWTGKAFAEKQGAPLKERALRILGQSMLEGDQTWPEIEVLAEGFENSKRKVVILKPKQAYLLFENIIFYYIINCLVSYIEENNLSSLKHLIDTLPVIAERTEWLNVGGQLLPKDNVRQLIQNIENENVDSWDAVHSFYGEQGELYSNMKLYHAIACLQQLTGRTPDVLSSEQWNQLLDQAIETKEQLLLNIITIRAKDYSNPFRQMVYDTQEEMDKVIGKFSENSFVEQEKQVFETFKKKIEKAKILFVSQS